MKTQHKSSPMFRWMLGALLLTLVIIEGLLFWFAYSKNQSFREHHEHIAKSTVELVTDEISRNIEEYQYQAKIFTEDQAELVYQLVQNPDSDEIYSRLNAQLKRVIPDAHSFLIADLHGNPHIDDFDGNIGEICINDMQQHTRSKKTNIRIHPNATLYHIDIIVPWHFNDQSGLMLITFHPDKIARILKASSPLGHELRLVNKDQSYLIEIIEEGARNTIERIDYRMPEDEIQRIIIEKPVLYTSWALLDMHEPELFSAQWKKNLLQFLIIGVLLSLIIASLIIVLIRIEKKRLAAKQTKDEMFSLFSHDLRSPVVAIQGGLSLLTNLSNTLSQDKKDNLLRSLNDNADAMQAIINNILDTHKIESNKMSFNFDRINLRELCEKIYNSNEPFASKFNVRLTFNNQLSDVVSIADEQRITQAITNLISNAVKFTPAGGEVELKAEHDKHSLRISVKDYGPGIPEEFQPLLFRKFASSKVNMQHSITSTGLGLVIVQHIANSHDGYVKFTTSSQGTTFTVTIPIKN